MGTVVMLTGGGRVRHGPLQRRGQEQREGLLHILQLAVGASTPGPQQGSESRLSSSSMQAMRVPILKRGL